MRTECILFRLCWLGLGCLRSGSFFQLCLSLVFSQMAIGVAIGIWDAPTLPPPSCSSSPALSWPYRANPAGSSLAKLKKGNPEAVFNLILVQLVFWLEESKKSVKLLAKPGYFILLLSLFQVEFSVAFERLWPSDRWANQMWYIQEDMIWWSCLLWTFFTI